MSKLAGVLVLFLCLGCSFPEPTPTQIDGYAVTSLAPCSQARCQPAFDQARGWLDAALPGHPPVTRYRAFRSPVLTAGSGQPLIVEITLADGSVRGIPVICGIGLSDRCQVSPEVVPRAAP